MARKKRIIVSVSNDLVTDQRVKKVCAFLEENNFEVILLGRKLPNSLPVTDRNYRVKRFRLWFNRGPLFYANLNTRLFFFLLFKKTDWLLSNDLDTLPANYYVSKLKRKSVLVYDTHEIFCEVPELKNGGFKKKMWSWFEKRIFPRLKKVYTVNQSISDYYSDRYRVRPRVVRNISSIPVGLAIKNRPELGLPLDKFIVIIQGSGINKDRGSEEVVQAMKHLGEKFLLLIVGSGDVVPALQQYVAENGLAEKVWFKPRMKYEELMQYTSNCDLGISLDKNTSLNYHFSLPNKLFDFIHAGIPVLASDLPEIKKIVEQYQVGKICSAHEPVKIAEAIRQIAADQMAYGEMKRNCKTAALELNWENEKKVLKEIYEV